jgi:hypothetical protein
MYSIYKISNNFDDKMYIGQTIKSIDKRLKRHCEKSNKCRKLRNAIQKHGYNITKGGEGFRGKHSEESKKKISQAGKGKPNNRRKLTFEQAEQIREEYKVGNISTSQLAKKYKIVKKNIILILHNRTYTK